MVTCVTVSGVIVTGITVPDVTSVNDFGVTDSWVFATGVAI